MNKINIVFKYLFIIPLLAALFVGCADEGEPIVEPIDPLIESVNPEEGMPGTEVVLTGEFNEVTEVRIDDEPVADFDMAADSSTISFSIPEMDAGFVMIAVLASDGRSDEISFTVLGAPVDDPEPVITSISPEDGLPGTTVTLEGELEGVTAVNFADGELEQFELAEDGNSLTFIVPEGTVTGEVEVRVSNSAGEAETTFTVLSETTAINFDPTEGPVGTEVVISGADFSNATAVRIGDMEITDIAVAGDGSTITFEIPEGAESGLISVVSPTETLESADEFTVEEQQTETLGLNPSSGPVGTLVTLTGMDFSGVTSIMLGDMEITDVEVPTDGSSLSFEVPEGAESGIISVGERQTAEEFIVTEAGQAINANGDLETADVGVIGEGEGQVEAPGWAFSGNDGELATFEIVDDPTQEGDRALAANVMALGDNAHSIEARQESISVAPNTTYVYSVWTRGPAGTSADFTVGRPDFTEFEGGRATAEMTGDWQEVSFQFTTGENDTEIRTPIHFSKAGNAGQTIYVDNLQIMEAAE